MIIRPKIRGFVCTTAHPVGCAALVDQQIDMVKQQAAMVNGPKKALIIGASTGFGIATRLMTAFGANAATLGVFFERPADMKRNRPASAGYYNTAAFTDRAKEAGLYAKNLNGDAFSAEMKQQVIEVIKEDLGQVDLVVYSLASPRRTLPNGETVNSVLKPIGQSFSSQTVDTNTGEVSEITIEQASDEEISHTEKVMGGEDWADWINALSEAGVLTDDVTTVAYSYIGPRVTTPVYRNGTIGRAKNHLEATAKSLNEMLSAKGGRALVSVNKALVTQSSSAIPVIPLYISMLYKVMKEKGMHEGCTEQIIRLFNTRLYSGQECLLDEVGRARVDDLELRDDVQEAVEALWEGINTENFKARADYDGYQSDFLSLFGFGVDGIDYDCDVEIDLKID